VLRHTTMRKLSRDSPGIRIWIPSPKANDIGTLPPISIRVKFQEGVLAGRREHNTQAHVPPKPVLDDVYVGPPYVKVTVDREKGLE